MVSAGFSIVISDACVVVKVKVKEGNEPVEAVPQWPGPARRPSCPFLSIRRESPLLRFRLLRGEREGAIFAERMSSGVCWEGVTQSRSPLPGLAAAAVRIAASRIGGDRHASCLFNLRLPIGWYPARLILEGGGREDQIGLDLAVFGGIYLFLLTTSSSTTARWKHQTGGKMPQMQDL